MEKKNILHIRKKTVLSFKLSGVKYFLNYLCFIHTFNYIWIFFNLLIFKKICNVKYFNS